MQRKSGRVKSSASDRQTNIHFIFGGIKPVIIHRPMRPWSEVKWSRPTFRKNKEEIAEMLRAQKLKSLPTPTHPPFLSLSPHTLSSSLHHLTILHSSHCSNYLVTSQPSITAHCHMSTFHFAKTFSTKISQEINPCEGTKRKGQKVTYF